MGRGVGVMDGRSLVRVWLIFSIWIVLCVQLAAAIVLPLKGFHPSQLLSPGPSWAEQSAPSTGGTGSASTVQVEEIKEDQVMFHFYRNGKSRTDYRKPSTKFMVNLFNQLQKGGKLAPGAGDTNMATDTIRSFSGKNSHSTKKGRPIAEFYIPYLPPHERLRMAEIRFLRNPKVKAKSQLYKFKINVKNNGRLVNKIVVRERSKPQSEYDVFDVSKIVNPWINDFHGNISLIIRIIKKPQSPPMVALKDNGMSTSLIVLYLQDSEFLTNMYSSFTDGDGVKDILTSVVKTARPKRSATGSGGILPPTASTASPFYSFSTPGYEIPDLNIPRRRTKRNRNAPKWKLSGRKENCQLHNFEVDFNTIGWGQWIIHPKKFNARFCFGVCPSPIDVKYKPTNHAMLQALMRMKKPNIAPVPCCVPSKLNALSMMYFEYNELVVRHHEDMVAEECGCR